ncbi:MAG: sensor histidine kinase [Pseudonocardiaceae bacterium]|nr:MAG: sensor histidine kinase [Pseudonocardiaceae bacterium]
MISDQPVASARPNAAAATRRLKVVVPAVVVGIIQVGACTVAGRWQPDARPLDVWAYLLLVAGPAALLVVRRHPVPVLIATVAASFAYFSLGYPGGPAVLAAIVALVATVVAGQRLAAWLVGVVGIGGYLLGHALAGNAIAGPGVGALVGWTLVVLVGSEGVRIRRERIAEERRRAEEYGLRCATEERLRIARELHDVLGHHISLINVQAGVALHLMDGGGDPAQTREALTAIKRSSKEVLREMRTTLGVLRDADEAAPRGPVPGLGAIPDLVGRVREAGADVRLVDDGPLGEVGEQTGLAAYRIVQEALTNVRRHAPGAAAVVTLRRTGSELHVTVVDDGVGASAARADEGAGRGIAGMTERAAALSGTLTAAPVPSGGFRVDAVLPVGAA